jgi:thymidine kinase
MFPLSDITPLVGWLKSGKEIVASGLDLDYRGQMFDIIRSLHQLKPDQLICKTAICDTCHQLGAQFTTIWHQGQRLYEGLPPVVPEDGTYTYEATCRTCFLADPTKSTHPSFHQQSLIQ